MRVRDRAALLIFICLVVAGTPFFRKESRLAEFQPMGSLKDIVIPSDSVNCDISVTFLQGRDFIDREWTVGEPILSDLTPPHRELNRHMWKHEIGFDDTVWIARLNDFVRNLFRAIYDVYSDVDMYVTRHSLSNVCEPHWCQHWQSWIEMKCKAWYHSLSIWRSITNHFKLKPRTFVYFQGVLRCFSSTFGGIGSILGSLIRFTHFVQLCSVNPQSYDTHDDQSYIDSNLGRFHPSNFSKFVAYIVFVVGVCIAFFSHCALLWSGWRHWPLFNRLATGIIGWSVAVFLISHSIKVLLGIGYVV